MESRILSASIKAFLAQITETHTSDKISSHFFYSLHMPEVNKKRAKRQ